MYKNSIEFNDEEKYLKYSLESIDKEIASRKKEMEEIPKKYTKALQGDSFLVESLMSMHAMKLRKLELSKDSPYFGRIDFTGYDDGNVLKIYIGKTNVSNGASGNVITDWRAPICSLYYDSEKGPVEYESPQGMIKGLLNLKRQIIINSGKLIDVLDTDQVSEDDLLKPYLSVNADNKMKTIIASIQKEQNKIIRMPISDNIIVQGVAGSGKTSVALHRIAYLIYSMGDNLKNNQFLILGPNSYFLDYISSVLPELDTEPVEESTFIDLVNKVLEEKLKLDNSFLNCKSMRNVHAYMTSEKMKHNIDEFMSSYINEDIISEPLLIDNQEVYTRKEIASILHKHVGNDVLDYKYASFYFSTKFNNNKEEIYDRLNKKYRDVYIKMDFENPERAKYVQKSSELKKIIQKDGNKIIKQYFKKIEKKAKDVYLDYINSLNVSNTGLSEIELAGLKEHVITSLKAKKISIIDMPSLLHINYLLFGKTENYSHLVIDEAQDYGIFHFIALKELLPKCTFSIYGDLAQAIYPDHSIQNWECIIDNVFNSNCQLLNLNKSYRTTIQITNCANNILRHVGLNEANPVIRSGEDVCFYEKNNDLMIVDLINECKLKNYQSVAVICKSDEEVKQLYKKLQNKVDGLYTINVADNKYNGGVFITTAGLSKGLEFDSVIINDASEKIYDSSSDEDMHLLYVACTRALHEMNILYSDDLCVALNDNQKKLSYKGI